MKKVRTSPKGRKCKILHCVHMLSIYNHSTYCHVHLRQLPVEQKVSISKSHVS
jgi:hypothetical protein